MTVIARCLLESKYAEDSQTTQYTAPAGTRTIVDKFTGFSSAGGSIIISIISSGGSPSASNINVSKTLAAGDTYTFPELVGQVLNPGDFISSIAATASTVVIRISGRENT